MKTGLFALLLVLTPSLYAQTTASATAQQQRRADAYYHFSQARLLDSQERFTEAIEEYKKALDVDPKNSTLYSEMAQTYLRNRRVSEAVNSANKAVELNQNNIDAHLLLSRVYWQQLVGNNNARPSNDLINSAVHEYEEIIRIDPTDPQAFILLGQLYQVNSQPDKAEELYKKHLKVDPGSEEGILALADLHIKSGDNKGAVAMLEDFLKNRPDSDRVNKELGDAYFYLMEYGKAAEAYKRALMLGYDDPDEVRGNYAQSLLMDERFAEAASLYEEMLKSNPTDAATLLRLSQIYRRTMSFDKARAALEQAEKIAPGSSEVQFNLYLVDHDEGKLEEGIARLNKLVKSTERPNGRYTKEEQGNRILFLRNIAVLNRSLGKYDQALLAYQDLRTLAPEKDTVDAWIVDTYRDQRSMEMANQYLQKALKEAPTSRQLLILSADITAERGKLEDGIKALEALAKGGQPDLELLSVMSEIYQRAKKWEDAQAVLDRAIKNFPMDADVYFLQGALFEKQKKDGDAEKAFRKALELESDSAAALNYLGYMLADRGVKLEEALSLIQKAVDMEPTSGAYLDSLGWVYYKMNRLMDAETYLKKAVRFASTDATMHDHLGDLYNKTMRYSDAASEWQKALQLANDSKEKDTISQIKKKLDQIKSKIPNRQL